MEIDVAVLSVGQRKPLKPLNPLGIFRFFRNERILAVQKRNSAWLANLRFRDWLEDVGIVNGWAGEHHCLFSQTIPILQRYHPPKSTRSNHGSEIAFALC